MKTKQYTWDEVREAANSIIIQMYNDSWRPDCVAGVTGGGLPLALMISHSLKIPMFTLSIDESNLWLSEDAFGYVPLEEQDVLKCRWDPNKRKNILIIDSINDTGDAFEWIMNDWQSSCLPQETNAWEAVWGKNVRFAAMTENIASNFELVTYCYDEINKSEEDIFVKYPWE